MPIGSIIPWSDFTTETNEYSSTLTGPMREAGVSATTNVKFTIDNFISYLNSLKVAGATEFAVNMAVVNAGGENKLNVIFTAAGATEPSPFGTQPYNLGELRP